MLYAAAALCALISILLTGFVVIVIGDVVERRKNPARGLATCRAMRDDAIAVTAAVRQQLASVELPSSSSRRRPRPLRQSAD